MYPICTLTCALLLIPSFICQTKRDAPQPKVPQSISQLMPPSSGVMKLIIKTYVEQILKSKALSENHMKEKLLTLSDHIISHPALHQKYLWVGTKPPLNYDPDKDEMGLVDDSRPSVGISKRNKDKTQFPSEEICKTERKWEQVNKTHDFYDNQVDVVQEPDLQQFIFSYRCSNSKGPCIGISPLYHSECTERNGWMYMYYRKKDNKSPQWGYVSAPHHCACKIQPKYVPTVSSNEMES